MSFRHNGAEFGSFVIRGTDLARACLLYQDLHQLIRYAFLHYDHRQCHASLARAAERRIYNACRRPLKWGVFEHEAVIFGFTQALHPLAVGRRSRIDVLPYGSGAYERNALYISMFQKYFGFVPAARDDVQNSVRKSASCHSSAHLIAVIGVIEAA